MAYVYKITNTATNKCYIGQTIRDWNQRKCEHFWHLRNNSHKSAKLQSSYNKWGPNVFKFEVIWIGDDTQRGQKEIEYIQQYDSYNNGYNMTPGGEININGEKEIFVYDEWGQYVTSFKSLSEAARQLHSSPQNIYQALYHKNNRKSIKGPNKEKLQFSYINLPKMDSISDITYNGKKTEVYNYSTGELLGVYESTRQAAREWDISETTAYEKVKKEKEKVYSDKANDFIYFKRI